jgi:hypothetical protein
MNQPKNVESKEGDQRQSKEFKQQKRQQAESQPRDESGKFIPKSENKQE